MSFENEKTPSSDTVVQSVSNMGVEVVDCIDANGEVPARIVEGRPISSQSLGSCRDELVLAISVIGWGKEWWLSGRS